MAEIGWVAVARVALRMGQAGLPAYRRQVSTPRCQPPPRLAVLCLRRDEEWPFRAAEGRRAEPQERRVALGLPRVPDSTTLDRLRRRRNAAGLEQTMRAVVQPLASRPSPQATVAVDAPGLAPGARSPFVVKRAQDRSRGAPGATGCNGRWPWTAPGGCSSPKRPDECRCHPAPARGQGPPAGGHGAGLGGCRVRS
jgi:hypothetical protein